ncbi:hypothetical protein ACLB2K_029312 [Fragaria x ananassa]
MASHRGWKICATVTGILLITILVVLVVLFLTVLKLKEPDIVARPINLEGFDVIVFPVIRFNVTIGILITVKNRSYGSFKYDNSTAHISYRGKVIAEAPLEDDLVEVAESDIKSRLLLMNQISSEVIDDGIGDAIEVELKSLSEVSTIKVKPALSSEES